ncbi:outer membrane protein assembly factor BamD [Deferribacter autotrophicus]|uniref:Outer membrane protein assembly factor BamD n=1 Tax=Deferribacter autotrophicus TaxID=500465 RepID=A0A5A8F3D1_9BACT|nr:outer membrane protein assembly factor BamD [Deferribacter autotrophicus]KAA0258645.1 outer membrane protein assembly factor BamD [Deferribacter autotrophicus]
MKKLLIFLLGIFLVISCAGKHEQEKDAATLFKEGLQLFQKQKYEDSAILFEEALKKANNPELAAKSQLFLADSYYLDEKYDEAIAAYKSYLELYENSEDAKRALLRLGLSYYAMLQPIDRDQSYTRDAYKTFLTLREKYPEYAKQYEVDKKIKHLRDLLAEKNFYVAKFYVRIGKKKASLLRLEKIIKEYKDTKVYPEAALLYAKVLVELNKPAEAVSILTDLLRTRKEPRLLPGINELLMDIKKKIG